MARRKPTQQGLIAFIPLVNLTATLLPRLLNFSVIGLTRTPQVLPRSRLKSTAGSRMRPAQSDYLTKLVLVRAKWLCWLEEPIVISVSATMPRDGSTELRSHFGPWPIQRVWRESHTRASVC